MNYDDERPDRGGDDIWDENQWEAFMKANDQRASKYVDLVYTFLAKYPRPLDSDPEAVRAWKAQLRLFLESKGWDEEDTLLPLLWIGTDKGEESDQPPEFEDEDPHHLSDFDQDEALLDESFEDDFYKLQEVKAYQQGMELASQVLRWAHDLELQDKDLLLVEFCAQVNKIPAKIAGGHGMGYEKEALGGNIACVKRALRAANMALKLLPQLKNAPFMDEDTYLHFYERTHTLRNEVGIYVQELRRRFDLGID